MKRVTDKFIFLNGGEVLAAIDHISMCRPNADGTKIWFVGDEVGVIVSECYAEVVEKLGAVKP